MAKAAAFIILVGLVPTAHSTSLPDITRRDFVHEGVRSCLIKQQQDPLSKSVPEARLVEYCTCTMDRAADELTMEDLEYVIKTEDKSHVNSVAQAAGYFCINKLKKEWGYTK